MLGTIWLALAGFVVGEAGKTRHRRTGVEPGWAWPVSCAGMVACVVHILVAMAHRHGWSHDAAVLDTAHQTAEVFGVAWGGGVFVNYLFVSLWLVDLFRWRADPRRDLRQPRWARWAVRTFYLVIVFNAAVVFAAPDRRVAGIAVTAALLAAWAW